jgi:hypothetical protein
MFSLHTLTHCFSCVFVRCELVNPYLWPFVVGLNVFKMFDWSVRKLLTVLLYRLLQNNVCNIVVVCDLFVFVSVVYNFSGCFVLNKAQKSLFQDKI